MRWLFLLYLLFSISARAEIHLCVDVDGKKTYSDLPCNPGSQNIDRQRVQSPLQNFSSSSSSIPQQLVVNPPSHPMDLKPVPQPKKLFSLVTYKHGDFVNIWGVKVGGGVLYSFLAGSVCIGLFLFLSFIYLYFKNRHSRRYQISSVSELQMAMQRKNLSKAILMRPQVKPKRFGIFKFKKRTSRGS